MATMTILGKDLTIVYVDPVATGANDGTTMANALTALPSASSFVDNRVYLIRRQDTETIQITSTTNNSTVENIFFVGFPLSTDELFNDLPAADKISSWVSDGDTHATIFYSSGSNRLSFSNLLNFGAHRIRFKRNNNVSANQITSSNLVLYNNGSNADTMFMTNCLTLDKDRDFSDNGYSGTLMTTYGFTEYIKDFGNVIIKNNKVIWANSYNSYYYDHMKILSCNNILIDSNEFWVASKGAPNTGYTLIDVEYTCRMTTFTNNVIKYYGQAYATQYFNGVSIQSDGFDIQNNKFLFDRAEQIPTAGGSRSLLYAYSVENTERYASSIRIVKDNLFDMRGANVGPSDYAIKLIMNRSSETPSTDYQSVNGESMIENISGYWDDYSAGNGNGMYIVAPGLTCKNLHIEYDNSSDSSHFALNVQQAGYIVDSTVKGKCYIDTAGFVELDDLTYSHNETSSILSVYDSIVHIKNMSLTPGWSSSKWLTTNNDDASTSNGNGSRIIIDSIDAPAILNINNTSDLQQTFGIWLNNVNGIQGNWYATNYFFTGLTWGTARMGGSTASIKLNGVSDVRKPLLLAPATFRGIEMIPNASSGTIKVYVAFKLVTNEEDLIRRFRILTEINQNGIVANKSIKRYDSSIDGRWLVDTISTWSEPGLTKMVYEFPFSTDYPADPVTIRYAFDWYIPSGVFYLDPKPELV